MTPAIPRKLKAPAVGRASDLQHSLKVELLLCFIGNKPY